MFCPNCGANLKGDAKFCPKCGTQVNILKNQSKNDSPDYFQNHQQVTRLSTEQNENSEGGPVRKHTGRIIAIIAAAVVVIAAVILIIVLTGRDDEGENYDPSESIVSDNPEPEYDQFLSTEQIFDYLDNPTKSCNVYCDGELNSEFKLACDDSGNILFICYHQIWDDADEGYSYIAFTYDENGNILTQNVFALRTDSNYLNGMDSKEFYGYNNRLDYLTEYTYDEQGNRISSKSYSVAYEIGNDGNLAETGYQDDGTNLYENTYVNGELKTQKIYDNDDFLTSWIDYEYDDNGFVAKEVSRDEDGEIWYEYEYENDDEGNVIAYEDSDGSERSTFTYNDQGDCLSETRVIHDSVENSTFNFEYEWEYYD